MKHSKLNLWSVFGGIFLILGVCGPFQAFSSIPKRYFSQNGQDKWLVSEVFNFKKKGSFVELGASEGIKFSNTYALEKFLDWKGICIEFNPLFFEKLKINRPNSICIKECVDARKGVVTFLNSEMLGGIVDKDTDNKEAVLRRNYANPTFVGGVETVTTKTLTQILDENRAPKVIDYLSLDVSGAEYRIMKTFRFKRYTFLAMTVERCPRILYNLLIKNGYIFIKNYKTNSYFVHSTHPAVRFLPKEKYVDDEFIEMDRR